MPRKHRIMPALISVWPISLCTLAWFAVACVGFTGALISLAGGAIRLFMIACFLAGLSLVSIGKDPRL